MHHLAICQSHSQKREICDFLDHTARLMSATVLLDVLWPITDVQLYVLMRFIASREVRCFECLLHAVTSLPRIVRSEAG